MDAKEARRRDRLSNSRCGKEALQSGLAITEKCWQGRRDHFFGNWRFAFIAEATLINYKGPKRVNPF